jgi:pimeloyl-ACP methyl ester carboxylesterase
MVNAVFRLFGIAGRYGGFSLFEVCRLCLVPSENAKKEMLMDWVGLLFEDAPITISGKRLHVRRIRHANGDGEGKPVLVFLHEGLGSIELWREFPQRLAYAAGCDAVVYDRMGHGNSSGFTEKRRASYLHTEAELFLSGLLDELNLTNVILVGHSDGGSIALLYASLFPSRVSGVITEAAHVFVEEEALSGIRKAVEIFLAGTLRKRLEKYHGENTAPMFHAWADTWLDPAFSGWNIESFLPGIKSPLLVIQGEEDEYGTLEQVTAIAEKSGGRTEALAVPACGHTPHLEAGELVLSAMEKHIKKNCTP